MINPDHSTPPYASSSSLPGTNHDHATSNQVSRAPTDVICFGPTVVPYPGFSLWLWLVPQHENTATDQGAYNNREHERWLKQHKRLIQKGESVPFNKDRFVIDCRSNDGTLEMTIFRQVNSRAATKPKLEYVGVVSFSCTPNGCTAYNDHSKWRECGHVLQFSKHNYYACIPNMGYPLVLRCAKIKAHNRLTIDANGMTTSSKH